MCGRRQSMDGLEVVKDQREGFGHDMMVVVHALVEVLRDVEVAAVAVGMVWLTGIVAVGPDWGLHG